LLKIAHLSFLTPEEHYSIYKRFEDYCQCEDLSYDYLKIETHSQDSWKSAWNKAFDLVEEADIFLVTQSIFLHSDELRVRLGERILHGARVFVTLVSSDDQDINLMNRFLSDYGLAYSGIKVRSNEPGGTLTIKNSEDAYRDSTLFRGSKDLTIGSATSIDYFNDARAVLFCSVNNNFIDRDTDKLVT
jgi:hypothetical protein